MRSLRISHKLWLAVGCIVLAQLTVVGVAGVRSARAQAESDALSREMTQRVQTATRWAGLTETNAARTLALVLSTDAVVEQALAWAGAQLAQGPVLIYATATPDAVRAVQAQLGVERAGALVEETLAAIAQGLVRLGVGQLIVAGGETSGAVVKALGVAGLRIAFGIDEDVAGIDFAEIMHEQHLDHPVHVAARRRVGRECLGEEGDLPAVLGGVLKARKPERTVLACHAFELVEFENEGDGVVHGGDSGLKRLRRDAAQDFAFGGIVLVSARQGTRFRPARRRFAFARWRRAFSGRLWGEGVR